MDDAAQHFDAMLETRTTEALFMPGNPAYDDVRKWPAFWTILEKHGLDRFARGDLTAIPPRRSPPEPH
jgi:hypothetical protein